MIKIRQMDPEGLKDLEDINLTPKMNNKKLKPSININTSRVSLLNCNKNYKQFESSLPSSKLRIQESKVNLNMYYDSKVEDNTPCKTDDQFDSFQINLFQQKKNTLCSNFISEQSSPNLKQYDSPLSKLNPLNYITE